MTQKSKCERIHNIFKTSSGTIRFSTYVSPPKPLFENARKNTKQETL